ncbi:putative V-type proton ATPase subunit H-like [Capsicum annuum]|uniref:uncharacterized protein LOC107841801 n=1 Tax=Capsicum annuum TaxID=4072 RepID=UPI0007BF46DB|nr:uncharacterized protein LOC107841801 [Capsicum annuum]KAF3652538.1 putative V-type proton ATPase subunit H-like [Capsicum annuum]KAF3679077.1 putative V-type proton ATPase subunit H-like [Capsicum annuum]
MATSARRSTGPVLHTFDTALASSIRFHLNQEPSPNRFISAMNRQKTLSSKKRACMCSPTNHPGSFRCSMHKKMDVRRVSTQMVCTNSIRLHMRRSAMANSLVRIGNGEGELVKRALAALIRPSSHQQRRRADFQRRPSRLSLES